MKMGLVVLVRNLLLTLCLCLVLGFMYYAAWKLQLLRWEDPRPFWKEVAADGERRGVTSRNIVESASSTPQNGLISLAQQPSLVLKMPSPKPLEEQISLPAFGSPVGKPSKLADSGALTFDSVGRTLGSGLAVDSGQSRTQKKMIDARAAQSPAQPKYDRLGFLLKLDSKLPAELATKYANLSDGACKPGYASALMTAIFPKFSRPAPMFLDDSFRKWARIRDFVPPFGIKGQDNLIKAILSATKEYRLTPALDSLSCRRCIIIGNGGVLANKSLGARIDDYDIVVRLNSAPVKGFEKDVGGKTTLRITYPEGAMQRPEEYEKDSLFVLAGFKWQDFKWLKYIVYKEKVSASDGFWKSVATRVPKEPPEIRILNPYFIQEAAFSFIGLPFNHGLMGRGNIPTLGTVAVTMALHSCDQVAVAGFGYDMSSPNAPLHYYESVRMAAIKESWTHNIQREKEFLRKLVKAHVITDLTSGI